MIENFKLERKIAPNKIDDIQYLEGKGYSINIYFKNNDKKTLVCHLLKAEKILMNCPFIVRVHRSYMVNMETIASIHLKSQYLKLNNEKVLPIGNQYLPKVALFEDKLVLE